MRSLKIRDTKTNGFIRARVWSHLLDLAQSGVTIIITTHYVEEARDADTIGFMREGRHIAQDSPNILMEMFKVPTLEKVFLSLFQQQE